jgi:hypothetical protein
MQGRQPNIENCITCSETPGNAYQERLRVRVRCAGGPRGCKASTDSLPAGFLNSGRAKLSYHHPRVITHDIHFKGLSRLVNQCGGAVPFEQFTGN